MKLIALVILILVTTACLNNDQKQVHGIEGAWEFCYVQQEDNHSQKHMLIFKDGIMKHVQKNYFNTECNQKDIRSTRTMGYSYTLKGNEAHITLQNQLFTIHELDAIEPTNDDKYCGYSDWQKDVEKDITKDTCEDQKTNVGEKDIVKFKLDKNSNKMTVGTKIYTRVE